MWEFIIQSLYLLLPAYLANACASLSGNLKISKKFNLPLDHYHYLGKNYILGPGKTYRGTIIGIIIALIIVLMQKWLYATDLFANLSLINYQQINILFLGLLAGLGTMGGDIVASFFKRRINLKSGSSFPLLDQWDFIIGFFLLLNLMVKINWEIIIISFILTLIIHPLTNLIAYLLKVKKVWW